MTVSSASPVPRSYLFAPGGSERLVASALTSDADVVVLDLEDALAPVQRGKAHRLIVDRAEAIAARPTHVRISKTDAGFSEDDARVACQAGAVGIRLPKVESADAVEKISRWLDAQDPTRRIGLFPTVESAAGLGALEKVLGASERIVAVVFGERDFLSDLGVDEPGLLTDHARASIAIRSRVAGVSTPIDGAFIDLDDLDGLGDACRKARSLGFGGKSAIHPCQLSVIHAVFSASEEEKSFARRVVSAYRDAIAQGRAVTTIDGRFVDAAVARRAEAILAADERRSM